MSLQALIKQVAGTDLADEHQMAIATVVDVDLPTMTCTVELTGGKTVSVRSDVLLMASVDDGILLVPAIESQVIVMWSTRNQPYVALFSQLQDIFLVADNVVTLQSDNFGGLVKVQDLVTRLNLVENKLNDIITLFNSHVHVASGTPTSAPTIPVAGTLTPTQRTDIENTKVVHGN